MDHGSQYPATGSSSGRSVGLLDDREANAGLVAALFGYFAPAVFGFLAALERAFDLSGTFHQLVEIHRAELTANHPEIAVGHHRLLLLAELVHRVVGAARLQGGFAREVFLVLVADVGTRHVLMLGAGDALTD